MLAELQLNRAELVQIQTSWSYIQASNKYHKDKFIFRLYSNLLAANPKLRKILNSDKRIREDSLLFGELLSFVVTFLQDETRLDRFFSQFCEEHDNFVTNTTLYLEPMGQAIVQTCEQWLGKGKFDELLENLWVKLYIFIANSLLQNNSSDSETSDAESTFSKNDSLKESEESDNGEVAPLNIKPKPANEPAQPSILKKSILFDLRSNEKYKGFRRSVQFQPEPISIEVPQSTIFEEVNKFVSSRDEDLEIPPRKVPEANFDPRRTGKSRSMSNLNDIPPEVPAKDDALDINKETFSPKEAEKKQLTMKVVNPRQFKFSSAPKVIYDSSDEEEAEDTKFDPRKLKNRKPSFTVKKKSQPEEITKKDLPKVEDSIYKEYFNYDTPEEVKIPERSVRRAPSISNNEMYNQVCLQPIIESDMDDAASSKYSSDGDSNIIAKSEPDDSSSGASSLSLHKYKSSLSSGTEPSESPRMDDKYTFSERRNYSPPVNEFNFIRLMSDLPLSRTYSNGSTTSLLPKNSSQARVSLGFMRSSFVLKKEMEQLGYNIPENIHTVKATQSMSNLPNSNKNKSYMSIVSSDSDDDACFDLINAFAPSKFSASEKSKGKRCNSECSNSRLHSITSKSRTSSKSGRTPWNYESKEIDPPKAGAKRRFSISSIFSRNSSRSQRKASSSGSESTSRSTSRSTSGSTVDARSVYTVGTTNTNVSGFSFFSKRIFSRSSVAVNKV